MNKERGKCRRAGHRAVEIVEGNALHRQSTPIGQQTLGQRVILDLVDIDPHAPVTQQHRRGARAQLGASSGKGGLGWYIFQNRNELYTDKVFAGLAVVILIGLLVENLVFDTLERVTVKRWGMQR